MKAQAREQEVRRYYDRNTRKFLRLSKSSAPQAIHQPLYVNESMAFEDALHTQHDLILEILSEMHMGTNILDLGCGVGESMLYLSKYTGEGFNYYGVTLSGTQAHNAAHRISSEGLSDRVKVIGGSFQSLPPGLPSIDLAFAIESFIHSPDPSVFFSQVSTVLKPSGRLIIFDDFLKRPSQNQTEERILSNLTSGWLANTLVTSEQVSIIAHQAGFYQESFKDLSGMLRLWRLRDRFIHVITPVASLFLRHSQYCRFLVGGNARQQAYRHGLLQYAMFVFS